MQTQVLVIVILNDHCGGRYRGQPIEAAARDRATVMVGLLARRDTRTALQVGSHLSWCCC